MNRSKIRLSPAEMNLFCDAQVILTKNSILQKATGILGAVQNDLYSDSASFLHHPSPAPKISKGENYLGLPYVILDYPRIAKGPDLLFIRSMFWWGNFYSITLQLAGAFKEACLQKLGSAYSILAKENYFIGVNEDPWAHHFEEKNYTAISSVSPTAFATILAEIPHTKIAAQWPLQSWDLAEENLINNWRLLTNLIT